MKKRFKKVLIILLTIIIIGIVYAFIVKNVGKGIPCIVKSLTGLNCPTCGITRQLVALISLDIKQARQYNIVLFYMYPFILIFLIYFVYRYLRYSKIKFNLFEIIYIVILCMIFLVWFIYRNIYMK